MSLSSDYGHYSSPARRGATSAATRAGVLLLCFMAGAFIAGAPASDAAWVALSLIPWVLALLSVPELPWRPAFAAWAAWIGWSGACALISPEPWLSLVAWWRGASVLFALGLAAAWWTGRERRLWSLSMIALGILGAAGLAAVQFRLSWPSALILPHGVWAAAGAAAAAGWLSQEEEGSSSLAWAALIVCSIATAAAAPWSARLALGAGGTFCFFSGARRGPGFAIALVVLAAAVIDPAGWSSWRPSEGWAAAVAALRSHPVSGVGPGLLGRELSRLGWPGRGVHSFVLAIGAETGYFGLLMFSAAAAASVPTGFKRLDAPGRAAASALVAFLAYAFLDDVSASPAFLAAVAGACAVGLSPGRLGEARETDLGTPLRVQPWFTAIGLAVGVAAAFPRELLLRSLAEADAAASPRARIVALERASRLAPEDGAIHARLAQESLLVDPARVGEALRRMRRATDADPANPVTLARLAELWAAFGALDRAAQAAKTAAVLEPRFVSPLLILAQWDAAQGRFADANARLEAARSLRGGSGAPVLSAWDGDRERSILEMLKRRKP